MLKQEEYLTDLVTWLVFIQYVVLFVLCTKFRHCNYDASITYTGTVDTRKHSHASAAMLLNCTYTYANKMSLVKRQVLYMYAIS